MDDTVASGQSKRTSCPISAVISSENVIILSCFGRYNNISPYGGILTGQLTKTGEELS